MSDDRTTELREKLTERGVEWTPRDSAFRKVTYWKCDDGKPVYYADATLGILCMTCTPEQAIAVTLGEKPRDKTEEWLLKACNQATQDYVKALEELVRDMWREITTCPDYTVPPCMTDGICERVRNLGVEMGGDGDE